MIKDLYKEQSHLRWKDDVAMPAKYTCGYCGTLVSSDEGMKLEEGRYPNNQQKYSYGVYVCTNCHMPTFIYKDIQVPGNRYGASVNNVPDEVNSIYEEARSSFAVGAYTGVVLLCRKLLMHIATDLGANMDLKFVQYVNYLNEHHYAGARSDEWVDQIRKFGNQANHEIRINSKEEAQRIIKFCEMILKINYEYPAIVSDENDNN